MKMFKSSCVALTVIAAGSASALAADLPSRTVVPVAPIVIPLFTWTGFYAGVNAGYGGNTNDNNDRYDPYAGTYGNNDSSDGGFVGGAQIGYNYQFGQFVAGIEADIQYADLGSSRDNNEWSYYYYTQNKGALPYYGTNSGGNSVEWFGTVRARLGFALDRALIYATGGFAYGGGGNDNNNDELYAYYGSNAAANGYPWYYGRKNGNDSSAGWVVGGGLEYAFTDSLTVKLEGLYVNLGSDKNNNYDYSYAYAYANSANYPYYYGNNRKNDREFAIARVGLNYKFSGF
ncbi:outer membrane protein [Chelatococcus asaccharovorans]|uniref:Outer membrane immunogenic protein n=1 Tax=Chelatococcus asaccharovorans TaxID=28210 RepID=A0A2V3UGM5_9HYPH|nr:porin family protein [Chelatococcus asaccharovorans]MBS7703834.1 porin family protein [Chelatococcus asaccharovorans]PXW57996.1 outer membrane immunogenic protein [Chelatococcus asaccharovorans]CAH1668393.1 Outer membrane immunogenic protein [Chelatococcus asaccharovorans]CAH1680161.1 Outer membrane immunogenic protein [Chelatococcus asaccharovorans]